MTEDFEPTAYFEELKTKLSVVQLDDLEKQLEALQDQIFTAKKLGQANMLHKLSFVYQTILREKVLLLNNINQYVYKEDIVKFIENVKPKDSVKIIELERFPRVIPDENAVAILEKKDFFDKVCIVFTDFTDDKHQSAKDKEVINRNKDPIAFGYFMNSAAKLRHDRYYFITDWEDEYCDLTLTKLVEQLGKLGIKNPLKTISSEAKNHINQVVVEALEDAEKIATTPRNNFGEAKPENIISSLYNDLQI